jgi:hypothetical protein
LETVSREIDLWQAGFYHGFVRRTFSLMSCRSSEKSCADIEAERRHAEGSE